MARSSGFEGAEGVLAAAVLPTDHIVIQRFNYIAESSQFSPLQATVAEIGGALLAGATVLAVGAVTLAAGTATVALATITAGSVVLLTEANATPNALGYVITAGTGFVIHSASGADTSSVSYIVLS